ncbi:transposase [Allopontixanthobacter sediminis]|uniref:transposase n=1 Tax=Allopontixanthobacter sediminis TaxID=1689985 RepID=UPI0038BB91C7
MTRNRFSGEQIIADLKEQEVRIATAEVCCRRAILSAKFGKGKFKYCSLELLDARHLRNLAQENERLQKHLAARCSTDQIGAGAIIAQRSGLSRSAQYRLGRRMH